MNLCSSEACRCRPFLGTYVEVRAQSSDAGTSQNAVEAAFVAMARVHRLMSFHDPASDVSRLNRQASRKAVTVDVWTFQVLTEARRLFDLSEGLFDVTIAPQLVAWGFLPEVRSRTRGQGSMADLELGPGHQVFFRRPLALDLGGLAKGFAVDRAVEAMQAVGATGGNVNAGGDLRVFGPRPRPLCVRHPGRPAETILVGEIRDEAAATSATYFSRRRPQGRWVSPILNPRTRRPWLGRASVTVVAPTCVVADALTKMVALAPERAAPILTRCEARALVVSGGQPRGQRVERETCTPAA